MDVDVRGVIENIRLTILDPSQNRPLTLVLLGLAATVVLIIGIALVLWSLGRRR